MSSSLFVYGPLAPGRPNAHVLADVAGSWQPAKVNGVLLSFGWGVALSYSSIRLDGGAGAVEGLLFTSDDLDENWRRLDSFEGDRYERVSTEVILANGARKETFIYVHHEFTGHGNCHLCLGPGAQKVGLEVENAASAANPALPGIGVLLRHREGHRRVR